MAANSLASGFLADFTSRVAETIDLSVKKSGASTPEHAYVLLDVAELYTIYGNYSIAENYIVEAKKTLESASLELKNNIYSR